LRILDGKSARPPSLTDIVILNTLPSDLPHVAGIISAEPQTPLSHVNLRAKQNNTPNAYLRDGANDPLLAALIGKIVKLEVKADNILIRAAENWEMEAFLEALRPANSQKPRRDLAVHKITALGQLGHGDLHAFGAKAANVAELRKILEPQFVPDGYAVPFFFYDKFMQAHGFYDEIRTEMENAAFQNDSELRAKTLKKFRKSIKKAVLPADLHDQLGEMQQAFPAGTNPRCRSSANNEDLVGFTGAGLYGSYTHRPDEGHIEKSIKQVWASLWKFAAFEERDFYRIDHLSAAMGVLVHPNFDDELANGVALTKNIYFPNFGGFYVNVQVGEALVTNPEAGESAEELLILEDINQSSTKYEMIRIRKSSLIARDKTIMDATQLQLLTGLMETLHAHFKMLYMRQQDAEFAMDIEFKIDKNRQLVIKQARPWVG
jgi:phosphoenolpyruvate synthase/pyruvate phosphate dikinase